MGNRVSNNQCQALAREFLSLLSNAFVLQSCVVTSNISWPSPPDNWSNTLEAEADGPRAGSTRGDQNRSSTLSSRAHPVVQVWAASLAVETATLESLKLILSKEELNRAARFHFEHHRNRFIAGRGLLRRILAGYLETDPATLQFNYGPNGKPALAGTARNSGIEFNLAHSEDLALLAVTHRLPTGVDVEAVRPLTDAGDLVARFFCRRENEIFRQLAVAEQPAAFFNLWTRKEALLKATGEGIGQLLNQVEVSFLPNEQAEFRHLPAQVTPPSGWTLLALTPAPGYTGALAAPAKSINLQCWKWEWPV